VLAGARCGGAVTAPLASAVPGVFAVGDVRAGSVKRCGAAIGEGAQVVASLHTYLAAHAESSDATPAMPLRHMGGAGRARIGALNGSGRPRSGGSRRSRNVVPNRWIVFASCALHCGRIIHGWQACGRGFC